MPLVSSTWAKILASESSVWDHLELSQSPQDWSKLTQWAKKHCKFTRALTIEDVEPGSEGALIELLYCGPFTALSAVKLTGSILSQNSGQSPLLWEALQCHELQSLSIQLDSISDTEIGYISFATGLQHLSLDVKQRSQATSVKLPGEFTSLSHLSKLSLRNVTASHGTVGSSFAVLRGLADLSLVRTGVTHFDFSFGHLPQLSSLLLSEDHRAGQFLRLPGISELSSLKRLSVSSGLEQFPEDIVGLTSLTSLDLGWNRFRMLPSGPYLKNLHELQFQERSSVLDVAVLEQASKLSLLSFDATSMVYKDITATVTSLIRKLPSLNRVVLLKASYNGSADREDQIAQSFLQLVNVLCQDMSCRRSIQIDLEHKWRPLLWSDVGR